MALIEHQNTISELRASYVSALATYQQEETGQDPETEERRQTHEGYTYVLTSALAILRESQAFPTTTSDPENERRSFLARSSKKLQELLEGWKGSIYKEQPKEHARTAMMETVLENLAAIKHYR